MNLHVDQKKQNILIIICLSIIAVIIGYLSSMYINNGPFINFYNGSMDLLYILIIILLMYLSIYTISIKHGSKLLYILTIALTVRILVVFAMSFFGFLPYQFDSNWDIHAFSLLQDWQGGNFHFHINSSSNVKYYSIITTMIYYLFSPNPIYMQFFNVFLGVISVYLLYLIANFLWCKKTALLSASIFAFWPTAILFSSMQMRESVATVLILAIIHFFLKWMRYKGIFNLVLVLLFIISSTLVRAQNGILFTMLLAPFIIIILWKNAQKEMKPLFIIGGFTLIGALLTLLVSSGYGRYFNFNYIATETNYRTGGGSSYLDWMTYGNLFDIIIYSPLRLFYFLYTPFPWHIKDVTELLAFFESLTLLVMTYYVLKSFKYLWEDNEHKIGLLFLILFCAIGLTANSIIDSNVGTAIRHKTQFFHLFFFLYAATYHFKKTTKYKKHSILRKE